MRKREAEAVLPLWQGLSDRLWEAATRNEIGLDRWQLGDIAEARAAFEASVAIARENGDRYGEGAALSNLCLTDLARGELKAGIACYEGALPALREVKATALEGSALISSGRAWDILGEPDQALDRYRQALESLDADRDFLKAGGVMDDDFIDAYIDLKMEDVMRVETTPHPVEFDMYYKY